MAGDAAAQYALGWHYLEEARDKEQARPWLRKAAEQGYLPAYVKLARLQDDRAEMLAWLRRGAELGDASCQCSLGTGYWSGNFGVRDEVLGTQWLIKAAAQEHYYAESLAYHAYRYGRGVEIDEATAFRYLRRSCEHGEVYSMSALAKHLADGTCGAPQDLVESHMWLSLQLPDRDDPDYPADKAKLDALESRMSDDEIKEARRRRRLWRPISPTVAEWIARYQPRV